VREYYFAHPHFLGPLRLLGTNHLAEPLREASQAVPLCGWAHGSQGYKDVPSVPRSGHRKFLRNRPYEALKRGLARGQDTPILPRPEGIRKNWGGRGSITS